MSNFKNNLIAIWKEKHIHWKKNILILFFNIIIS